MEKEKVPKKEDKKQAESIADTYTSVLINMFDKFEKALKMDQKGTPRYVIIEELKISSATFYKWIKNPKHWADQYKAKPDRLMRTTKEIIASVKFQENSLGTVRSLLKDLDLNEFELEFMYHYIEKRNSTEAIIRTMPPDMEVSRRTAKLRAHKLMQRKKIREGIDRIMQWELEGIHVTLANDIIGTFYRMAFYDPAMFIDEKGKARFKSIDDVPEEYRCCIKGIKSTFHPKDPSITLCEIQLADKQEAMKELMQYANLYEANNAGLRTIGEGVAKIQALIEKNKMDSAIDGDMRNITKSVIKDS
jgi:hypothetical protein